MKPDEAFLTAEAQRALLALSFIPGIGSGRLRALIHHFGDPQNVLEASARALRRVTGVGRQTANAIARFDGFDHVDDQLRRAQQVQATLLTWWHEHYPEALRSVYDPPLLLWVRGNLIPQDARAVAFVGTRRPTLYGLEATRELTVELVRRGFTIVSGLAHGIDAAAHRAALEAGGRTVAVLGSGVDRVYPAEHIQLAAAIEQSGAVLSEFPLQAKPDAPNFPRRNRIVSGLALGVVVAEAYASGGALITANLALEQNREVFAVPGVIHNEAAAGTNMLIRDGRAKLVQGIDDILAELGPGEGGHIQPQPAPPLPDLNRIEEALYKEIGREPVSIDAICHRTSIDPANALVYLLSLEFKGLVRQMAGKQYYRVFPGLHP